MAGSDTGSEISALSPLMDRSTTANTRVIVSNPILLAR